MTLRHGASAERSLPLVFAHRGASAERPEHTEEAYKLAISQGADGLECDVRLTRDGHLVCVHDRIDFGSRSINGRVDHGFARRIFQLGNRSFITRL